MHHGNLPDSSDDFCDHVLDYDWDALLGIGEVWTDLMLIQQRIESW